MNREKEVKAYLEGKLSQAEKLKYEIADETFKEIGWMIRKGKYYTFHVIFFCIIYSLLYNGFMTLMKTIKLAYCDSTFIYLFQFF